jgi:ATP-dependent RNA helicase RhlE
VRSTAIFGGMPMGRQVQALRAGVEVVVATPGRLLDHVRQGTVDLGHVAVLVLDEADRMLDMGFIHDIRRIIERLPSERQSLLFSATFSPYLRGLAEDLLRDPLSIDAAPQNSTAAPIRQVAHPVDHARKRELLSHLLRGPDMGQVLVFTRTKRGADRLSEQLGRDGLRAIAIHGNKNQTQRVRALTAFKRGDAQVLVATDIAARGLDIESLPHVVNFELPVVPEDYVHRIGRTGRAGQPGTAVSLVTAEEQGLMRAIERLLRQTIDREVIDGFEPSTAAGSVPVAGGTSRRPDTRKVAVSTPRRRRGHQGGHQSVVSGRSAGRVRSHVGAPAGRWAHAQSRLAPPGRTDGDGSAGHPGRHTRVILPGERLSGREPSQGRRSARRD